MTRAPFRQVQLVAIAFASLSASTVQLTAQRPVDPARHLTRQRIELAAAAYVGKQLAARHARGDSSFLKGLALDLRSTDYGRGIDDSPRLKRDVQHSAHLAKAMGVHRVTDGQHAVTCANSGTSVRPGRECRPNNIPQGHGLLRMSIPQVRHDSAAVEVHLMAPVTAAYTYNTAWDLLLVKRAGAWVVAEQGSSRTRY